MILESLTLEHYEKIDSYIPVNLLSFTGFIIAFAVVLSFILVRYFLMVGGAYSVYWKNKPFSLPGFILHDKSLPTEQIKNEIKWSLVSSFIFAFSGVFLGLLWQAGFTQFYVKFDQYGLWYLPLSFFLYTLVHEFYFYFTHVWMHKPSIYSKVHAVHHASVKISPWASFSFHPLEAIVHAAFLPVMVLWLPIHPLVVICYLTFMTITAISNHLGVEVIPFEWARKLFISGEHHSKHHRKMKINYGLYYTFIDRIMGTEAHNNNTNNQLSNMGKSYE